MTDSSRPKEENQSSNSQKGIAKITTDDRWLRAEWGEIKALLARTAVPKALPKADGSRPNGKISKLN